MFGRNGMILIHGSNGFLSPCGGEFRAVDHGTRTLFRPYYAPVQYKIEAPVADIVLVSQRAAAGGNPILTAEWNQEGYLQERNPGRPPESFLD